MPLKLNLGCGGKMLDRYLNVDHPNAATLDESVFFETMAYDLDATPWPWLDASVDEVYMQDSLEHLHDPHEKILEVARILKPGGIFRGGVPYAWSHGAVQATDHHHLFTEKSFDVFCDNRPNSDYVGKPLFHSNYVRLTLIGDSLKNKILRAIPYRSILHHFVLNIYNEVEFELRRL